MLIIGDLHYLLIFLLFFAGLVGILLNSNRIKKLILLGLLQASIILFFISLGFLHDGFPPIFQQMNLLMQNPLPHVLMLTAIVVGLSINALGLAIAMKIHSKS